MNYNEGEPEGTDDLEALRDTVNNSPVTPDLMPGLTIGRNVHYILPHGPNAGSHRAAIIVNVLDPVAGLVNLQVFTDGANDGRHYAQGMSWQTSVEHDPLGQELDTWHWIEPA